MDIDKIEITNNNMFLEIFPQKNYYIAKEKKYSIDTQTINYLIEIIESWDNNYCNNKILDGDYFNIKIYNDNIIKEINGIRKTPNNYSKFNSLIRSLYARR